jgi:hypothetical protein
MYGLHLWYPAEFFLEQEMFQTKLAEKIKTHLMFYNFLGGKSLHLGDDVEKYGRARHPTDDNIIRSKKDARLTHS